MIERLAVLFARIDCLFRGHDWETTFVRRGFYLRCLNCGGETPGIEVGDGSSIRRRTAADDRRDAKARDLRARHLRHFRKDGTNG